MRRLLGLVLALAGCGANTPASIPPSVAEEEDPRHLPELRRVGDLSPGEYLFASAPLGGREPWTRARLVSVGADAFTLSVDGGPHRLVSRREVWPMACLRRPLQLVEGALQVRLDASAPVFVLASAPGAARVSVGLASEHSRVVSRDALTLEGCTPEVPEEGARRLAATPAGDVACLFPDQETLDPSAGLPLPAGAPARVLDEDGPWARVEVRARGGALQGWMSADLVTTSSSGPPDWDGVALGSAQCLFPGRAGPRSSSIAEVDAAPERPSIPPLELERVLRNGASQVEACYQARLSERPELRVRLDVVLLVDADGRVASARALQGGSVDERLTSCVLERTRRWRFPPPRVGSVEVRRTFDLRP